MIDIYACVSVNSTVVSSTFHYYKNLYPFASLSPFSFSARPCKRGDEEMKKRVMDDANVDVVGIERERKRERAIVGGGEGIKKKIGV